MAVDNQDTELPDYELTQNIVRTRRNSSTSPFTTSTSTGIVVSRDPALWSAQPAWGCILVHWYSSGVTQQTGSFSHGRSSGRIALRYDLSLLHLDPFYVHDVSLVPIKRRHTFSDHDLPTPPRSSVPLPHTYPQFNQRS
ncbi:hypothetical protein PGTUg99_035054 [Puccinia graminis f. sp. tritici]|uniref:Uncharacterized protein n=1 Tax=Puccinia graminis f. sp. tritici TaxID=56615 RepID=A0A5B0S4E2_PUCGR|nr:hypothetical protein PGTUg99_035054 [Puccinia graminis f. sp. tritici]